MRLPVEYLERRRNYVLFKNDCGISDAIRGGGVYEQYIFDYINAHLSVSGTTILDVGGNLGQHALEFAELVGPTGKVHSFEAQRLVYYQLCANILLNGFSNIFAHHLALGDRIGRVMMETPDYCSSEIINIGNAHVDRFLTRSEPVEVTVLDRFSFTNVSVLKIDVEGYEPFVLDGARETILTHRPVVFIEIWDANLGVYGFTPDDVFSRLKALGYAWTKLIDADHIIDYVAVPK